MLSMKLPRKTILYLAIYIGMTKQLAFIYQWLYRLRFIKRKSQSILHTVLIIIDPDIRLYPTIKLWPVPSETGESLLVAS